MNLLQREKLLNSALKVQISNRFFLKTVEVSPKLVPYYRAGTNPACVLGKMLKSSTLDSSSIVIEDSRT